MFLTVIDIIIFLFFFRFVYFIFHIQCTILCVGTTGPRIEPESSEGSGVFFLILVRFLFLSPPSSPGLQPANTANFSTSLRCLATTRESTLLSERTIVCTGYSHCSPIWARTWAHTMINSNHAYSKVQSTRRTCFSHLT